MNDITTFTYENANIRTITTEDGTPLFCGKDVASILGYTNPNKAMKDHCKGVTNRYPLETPGGIQDARFIGDLAKILRGNGVDTGQRRLDEDCVDTIDATDNLGRPRQTNA